MTLKRDRVAGQEISRSVLQVDFLAVGFDVAAIAIVDGRRGAEYCRRQITCTDFEGFSNSWQIKRRTRWAVHVYRRGSQKPGD